MNNETRTISRVDTSKYSVFYQKNMSIIYRMNDRQLLKMLNEDFEGSCQKFDILQRIYSIGIKIPKPYELVYTGEKYGFVMEYISGETLSECVTKDPENMDSYIKKYLEVIDCLHSNRIDDICIESKSKEIRMWLETVKKYVKSDIADAIYNMIDSIPEETCLIHGDLHPLNVIVKEDNLYVMDMEDVKIGNHIFEFAGIYSALVILGNMSENSIMDYCGVSSQKGLEVWNRVFNGYYQNFSEKQKETELVQCKIVALLMEIYRMDRAVLYLTNLKAMCMNKIELHAQELERIVCEYAV